MKDINLEYYLKSNKKCSVCNGEVNYRDNFIVSKTRRKTYIVCHRECLVKK